MSNKEKHWEKTKGQMMITLALWFVFGYLIFMFGESLNSASFLGYPLAYYMCAQGSIIAFVVILFGLQTGKRLLMKSLDLPKRRMNNV